MFNHFGRVLVSYPDPTHSNEEKGLVLFEQFLGFADLAYIYRTLGSISTGVAVICVSRDIGSPNQKPLGILVPPEH